MNKTIEQTVPLSTYRELDAKYQEVRHELQWLKRQLFGQKSERFIPGDTQLSLDLDVPSSQVEVIQEDISYTRNKVKKTTGHSRMEMPTHLPFDDIRIEPQEETSGSEKIGEEVSWEFEYNPGTLFVRRYIRPKYKLNDSKLIVIGSLPERPIDQGNFGPGIMSSVSVDKYVYHLPLYRQLQKFRNEFNVQFAESTFCDLITRTVFWVEPVYQLLKQKLLQASYIQADETPMPVLIKRKKGKTHKGYYWVYFDPLKKIALFEYKRGRSREGPNEFLKGYEGVLQVDGYAGYNDLAKKDTVTRAACMAHVRRKFEQAREYHKTAAEYALSSIGKWFDIEREAVKAKLTYGQRCDMRQDIMVEEFAAFKHWMLEEANNHLPKSTMRKAIEYALGQWPGFDIFLNDGRVELSNNWVENAIRPVALGRKNYLFKGSESAAQRGAILYSIISTAKLHDKEPREYIRTLLEKLPGEYSNNIDHYLPWNINQ